MPLEREDSIYLPLIMTELDSEGQLQLCINATVSLNIKAGIHITQRKPLSSCTYANTEISVYGEPLCKGVAAGVTNSCVLSVL